MKSIIDKNTGQFFYAIIDAIPNLQENEIDIDELVTENFVKPYFDFETREFYEGATSQEITNANKLIVPKTVSKRQLKQALVLVNISLSSIDATISQIEDATEKALMEIYWNDSYEFERNHTKLVEFAQTLSITDEQADQIFILASTL